MPRHFLSLMDLAPDELRALIARAIELKKEREQGVHRDIMRNMTLAMIFEKSSTRTRVSFESGVTQLGGNTLFLSPSDSQLGRGEPIEDTAKVISRMVDIVVIRADKHSTVTRFAENSAVPTINALTDELHPCQLLADLQTVVEARGGLDDLTVAWVGDGNNVCQSWINASHLLGFTLRIATPAGFEPSTRRVERAAATVSLSHDPVAACRGADVVVADTWASMGDENEKTAREQALRPFQVNQRLMSQANASAIFMHCLPAYREMEVTADVIDGPKSVVWDEAENRLHAQKALLELLLSK